jgi:hypothetical protein
MSKVPTQANDKPENAQLIEDPLPFTGTYSNDGALSDVSDDPCALDGMVHGVWFAYTPSENAILNLEISEPGFALSFAVIASVPGGNRDCIDFDQNTVFVSDDVYNSAWNAIAGVKYEFLVAGRQVRNMGTFRLTLKASFL